MFLHSRKSIRAKKIAGSLVAAFPGATPPLVWKFDLEKNHSFTLALQGEEGDWELGVTSPRGEFYSVARFLSRDDAETAFARTQCALLKKERKFWNIAGPICMGLLVLSFIFAGLNHFRHDAALKAASTPNMPNIPNMSNMPNMPNMAGRMGTPMNPPAEMKEGVPVSADQVLVAPP